MATWQFEGTVSYQSGRKVAYAPVSLGHSDGQSVAFLFRTATDLSGRFEAITRPSTSIPFGKTTTSRMTMDFAVRAIKVSSTLATIELSSTSISSVICVSLNYLVSQVLYG